MDLPSTTLCTELGSERELIPEQKIKEKQHSPPAKNIWFLVFAVSFSILGTSLCAVIVTLIINVAYPNPDASFISTNCTIDNYVIRVMKYDEDESRNYCYYPESHATYIFQNNSFDANNTKGYLSIYDQCFNEIYQIDIGMVKYLGDNQVCFVNLNDPSEFLLTKMETSIVSSPVIVFSSFGCSALIMLFLAVLLKVYTYRRNIKKCSSIEVVEIK